MTATPANFNGWAPEGTGTQLPPESTTPQQASQQVGRGQYACFNATGHVALNDGTVPGLICAGVGYPAPVSGSSTIAGQAFVGLWQGFGQGNPSSTIAGDNFTAADVCTPAWIRDENTLGKLSNYSGSNRSLGGLVFGVTPDARVLPRAWVGPVAHAVARAVLHADASAAGLVAYPVDAGATTNIGSLTVATASLIIPRAKTHGVITSIEIIPSAALSATSGNDRTITVWKVDTLGVAAAVSVGTFITTTALVARTVAQFTLSVVAGALNMLETDILTYSTVSVASGAIIPQSAIRANMKVL